jgi:hypothetical protein
MDTYWGSGGIAPRILDVGTRWRWSASRPGRFTPRERDSGTHWIGGFVGPRAVLDTAVVKRKITSPRRESNPRTPIVQQLSAIPTELSRLYKTTEYKKKIHSFCLRNV